MAIAVQCARAEECDYKTCGALMARDGSASWAISGRRDYSPETKRACAELNACVRRAKSKSAERAAAAIAAGTKGATTVSKPSAKPADNPAKTTQPVSPCFAVAEILVPVDCSPSRPQQTR
jgi:hypothetical protein